MTEGLMKHLPFPFRKYDKSNLKFSLVRFYQYFEFEIIFLLKLSPFILFLPSSMGILPVLGFFSDL